MERKHQLRILDHLCLPARQTCAILSCALQERKELWDRSIYMHAGKSTKQNGGHTSSCVYHSNRDCFSHVTRDTKPPETPYDQYRLVDWYKLLAYYQCNSTGGFLSPNIGRGEIKYCLTFQQWPLLDKLSYCNQFKEQSKSDSRKYHPTIIARFQSFSLSNQVSFLVLNSFTTKMTSDILPG